ncbi:MAG: N-methyl-L-tryptophan oxidase [Pirellulaceae bacterium]
MYDAIVVGTGGVGSAAAYHLARRGCRVLGLDRFPGGHDRGSSHGQTRIIRLAYFEHPDYVPLLRRAYDLWRELEQGIGHTLYEEVGLLEVGPPDGVVIPGVLASARQHDLHLDLLDAHQVASRFPGFVVPDGHVAAFERRAGFLYVESCVLAHLAQASQHGAEFVTNESVENWSATSTDVTVRTDRNEYRGRRLIISAGAWARDLLTQLGIHFPVRRKHLHWYRTDSDIYRATLGAPCFFYETGGAHFYGFPQIDERGVKVAEHSGGTVVGNPLTDDRSVEAADRERVEAFLSAHLPQVNRVPLHHAVCYYTMSPDEHFVVDRHPGHDHICFAAGLSGHGFKFTSVLGEILADLSLDGGTSHPIDFFASRRFQRV